MASHNSVVLIGRLTRDPEMTYTAAGLAITKFSIAVDRKFKDARTGEKKTDFFDCAAFQKTAEFVSQYVTKGRLVCVDGRIEINIVESDGGKKYFTNVICESVETLDSQRDGDAPQAAQASRNAAPTQAPAPPRNAPARAPQANQNRAADTYANTAPAADDFDDTDPFADQD